ncbi:MAG: hypothetical protein IKJ73_03715 [Lachnospiraceae bacterium]|nr:hypothetical protein [Lachnospiraceae bacterium]
MNKIIVEVHVPSTNKIYDAKIPRDIQIWEVTKLLSDMIAANHPGMYAKDNDAILCDFVSGTILPANKLVDDVGLVNGSRVLLV